jgi:hypothetical protein
MMSALERMVTLSDLAKKSIKTISMSVMGLRSGPRAPGNAVASIALLRLGDTDARALEICNLRSPIQVLARSRWCRRVTYAVPPVRSTTSHWMVLG